ncbi:hypothetical protein M1145_02730 [Patescibacteria group bacterium]|nr:hypothetical protein [Patescibacteria group bacterium]
MKVIKIVIPIIVFIALIYLYVLSMNSHSNLHIKIKSKKSHINSSRNIPKVSFQSNKFRFLKNNFKFGFNPQNNSYYVNKVNLNPYSVAINLGFSKAPTTINGSNSLVWTNSKGHLVYSNNTYFEILNKGSSSNIQNYKSQLIKKVFNMGNISSVDSENIVGNTYVYKIYPTIDSQYIYTNNFHRFYESIILYSNKSLKSFSILPIDLKTQKGYLNKITLSYINMNNYPLYIGNLNSGTISGINIGKVRNIFYYDLSSNNIIPAYMIYGNVVIINNGDMRYESFIPKIKYN